MFDGQKVEEAIAGVLLVLWLALIVVCVLTWYVGGCG